MMKIEPLVLAMVAALMSACASVPIPYQSPVKATPPRGQVAVRQAMTLFDASGSQEARFAEGKATLESIVSVMPDGNYDAGILVFGGYDRVSTGLSRFNRASLEAAAKDAPFLKGTTPIFDVLENDVAAAVGHGSGRAAIVMISDGLVTDYAGRSAEESGAGERTVEAARAIVASRSGDTCFHMIQSGDDAAGADLLRSVAGVTNCGSFRNATSLTTPGALQQFARDVYLGGKPVPAPAPPRPAPMPAAAVDTDGDGVLDPEDACPNTLKKARVDSRGCWTLSDLRFEVNGAAIEPGFTASLQEDIEVLRANPDVRIRIDGHTDSDGPAAYNLDLSARRAESVRDYFVNVGGLSKDRFETKGFGETRPIAPNDTPANKRRNRRVELTIIE